MLSKSYLKYNLKINLIYLKFFFNLLKKVFNINKRKKISYINTFYKNK
jgi:hypothetical protein